MNRTLRVALDLAAVGLPVFPCGRQKKPAIAKKDGGRGFLDAVSAPDSIQALFFRAPRAPLIGVPTGQQSGFDVLDIDYRHGGGEWEEANRERLPETRIHQSQSGGRHYLFVHAPGVKNSASKFSLAPGVDVRGDGGYVIYPPSPGYSVISDASLAEWPDWLLRLVLARKDDAPRLTATSSPPDPSRAGRFCEAIIRKLNAAPEGRKHFDLRNTALLIGGYLHLTSWTADEAQRRLVEALPGTVTDWNSARATAAWGIEQGSRRPIDALPDRPDWRPQPRPNGHDHAPPQIAPPELAAPPPPVHDPRKPVIRVYQGLRHQAADEGMEALALASVPFYQRDRQMVRAALSKAKTADGSVIEVPSLMAVSLPVLSRALGQSAEWERLSKDGDAIRIDPPKDVVEQIAALVGHWPFPPVAGVIGTPTMRPDGSLLLEPGYDPATGLVLVSPPPMPPMPERPTRQHANAALARLLGLLKEFPFADNASKSVALSMLLTPVLRGALGAAVPMHVVAAPRPGTGKSYLQDVASVLATGERCAVITVAPDPSETEKRLVGAALAGFPIIALDNCNGTLTGDFLAQVTERPLLQLRPLGTSGVQRITNVFSVFANGNNIAVSADLVRRSVLCSLDANMEFPEKREFGSDPVREIADNRGMYLAACLTIARAYFLEKCPGRLARVPSFERWSDLVRSALVWLGQVDPVNSSDTIKADDPEHAQRAAIFASWSDALAFKTGYSTAEIIQTAERYSENSYVNPALRAALLDVAKSKTSDRIDPKRLGWWFRNASKVVVGNRKLTRDASKSDEGT